MIVVTALGNRDAMDSKGEVLPICFVKIRLKVIARTFNRILFSVA